MRVALVHDYLREYGGAERVLEALHEIYPQAPIFTAFVDKKALGIHWSKFADWQIKESWITKIPLYKKLYSPLRVVADKAFSSFNLSDYDLVISSSNAYMAKAVRVPNGTHICYCHTPPRALYGYTTLSNWRKNPFIRFFGTLINHYMRVVDYYVAQKVDHFIANSQETQRRIKKFYRRDSNVINPPVEIEDNLDPSSLRKNDKRNYFLFVSRLGLSKHPELAVQAANQLKLPLKVVGVGSGSMKRELKSIAGPMVEFMGSVADKELGQLYSGAKALIYPVEDEDFGMVPVEAMSYGVPVIAHRSGGPMETIIEGKTGIFFDDLTAVSLVAAINNFQKKKFDRTKIRAQAKKYSKEVFVRKIKAFVEKIKAK